MSKSKRRRRRDTTDITNQRLHSPTPTLTSLSKTIDLDRLLRDLRPVEDRRTFHPEGVNRPIRAFRPQANKIILRDRGSPKLGKITYPSQTKAVRVFQEPEGVPVCVRRQTRKEVLFARKKTGSGSRRRPTFNQTSEISCRRKKR